MTTPIISARGVAKQYRLGETTKGSLRDAIVNTVAKPFKGKASAQKRSFWALDGLDFDIQPGEVCGVVGRNGAGKSTLLKVLSRITPPTRGRIEMRGRVASLLEVGTGFNQELTGRENVYLNGSILGMRKREIDRKFDEIVAYAELEKFLDTPVKRYSSGMATRLAFGVAAHLDAEILVVDEVLAVGDAAFQRKALGKIHDISSGQGRTVLFVSHNMAAVRAICTTGMLLQNGKLVARGETEAIIDEYNKRVASVAGSALTFEVIGDKPQFTKLALPAAQVEAGEPLAIEAELFSPGAANVGIEIEIHDERGLPLIYTSTMPMGNTVVPLEAGVTKRVGLHLGALPLAEGRYTAQLIIVSPKPELERYHEPAPLVFEVTRSDPMETGFEFRQAAGRGAVFVPLRVDV